MYRIIRKKSLNPAVTQMDIEAPLVARKARPGQFIILRVDADGERIPLTIAASDFEEGSVTIIFQTVGATTRLLQEKKEGDSIADFVGPLGNPTDLDGVKSVCVVGGGVGCAIALPVARAFHARGVKVTSIVGFRNRDLIILQKEFEEASDEFVLMTDDGSAGRHGNVTVPLKEMLESGTSFDRVITIGPLIMMKFVTLAAKPFGVPVTVSMNPIMIDGTGMCGGCRLTLLRGDKRVTCFACVDGPEFNGYEIDFDEAMSRSRMYADFERKAYDKACRLLARADQKED